MARLSLDLPENLAAWVEEQASARGYESEAAFVADVLTDVRDRARAAATLRAEIQQGLDSGPSHRSAEDIRADVKARFERNTDTP
mgnify:CR=1 FL=1